MRRHSSLEGAQYDRETSPRVNAPAARLVAPLVGRGWPLRYRWLIVFAFAAQLGSILIISRWQPQLSAYGVVASYLLLLLALVFNLRSPGMLLVTLGVAFNLLVIASNGGMMPIDSDSLRAAGLHDLANAEQGEVLPLSKDRLLPVEQIRLSFLSDRINLHSPIPMIVSIGDVIMFFGLLAYLIEGFLAYYVVRRLSRRKQVV